MVDEGRTYYPENTGPEDRDIYLKYQETEKVEFAFTPYNGKIIAKVMLKNFQDEEKAFDPCNIDEIASVVEVVEIREVSAHYE